MPALKPPKTVFARNTNYTNTNGISRERVLNNNNIELSYFSLLQNFTKLLKELFVYYSLGDFENVNKILTPAKYTQLVNQLIALKRNVAQFPRYEQIRDTIEKSLIGLMKAMDQYHSINDLKIQLAAAKDRAAILDDMDRLREFLEGLKRAVSIFPDSHVKVIKAELKPQYAEYIKLYGYPQGGMFDPTKLADIIDSLSKKKAFEII